MTGVHMATMKFPIQFADVVSETAKPASKQASKKEKKMKVRNNKTNANKKRKKPI